MDAEKNKVKKHFKKAIDQSIKLLNIKTKKKSQENNFTKKLQKEEKINSNNIISKDSNPKKIEFSKDLIKDSFSSSKDNSFVVFNSYDNILYLVFAKDYHRLFEIAVTCG